MSDRSRSRSRPRVLDRVIADGLPQLYIPRARPDGLPRVLHRLRLHRPHLRLHSLRLHRLRLHRRLRLRLHRLQTEVSSEARQVSDLREDCAWLQSCWDPEHGRPYRCLARLGGLEHDVNAVTYSLGTVAGL